VIESVIQKALGELKTKMNICDALGLLASTPLEGVVEKAKNTQWYPEAEELLKNHTMPGL
jgi:hypothetical protein